MKFQMSKEQKIRMTQFTKIDQHSLFKHVIFIYKSNIFTVFQLVHKNKDMLSRVIQSFNL